MAPTVHASVVLVGPRAILIRGPAGAGKSHLVLQALTAAETGLFAFARLVADDRVDLAAAHGRLIARPVPELAGLLEVRGLGIRRLAYEPMAVVAFVCDLADPRAQRMPDGSDSTTVIEGIALPRLSVPAGIDPLPIVAAMLDTERDSR
jgi:serine kinase of HPr protein (carbohydrate metabolism regulator)